MKRLGNTLIKLGIGFIVNIFTIISAILNIWEFIKLMLIRIVVKLPETFNAIIGTITSLLLIYAIFDPSIDDIGIKIVLVVSLLLISGLIIRFSKTITNLLCAFLMFVLGLLDTTYIIIFMRDSIMNLVDKYLNYCDSDLKAIERIYVFGFCYIFNLLAIVFSVSQTVLSLIMYPLLGLCGAGFTYWLFYIDYTAPILWSFEFWMSVLVIILFFNVGIYLAFIFSDAVKETKKDTDFDLFYIFKIYSNTFKNFSKKTTKKSHRKTNPEQPKTTNKYFEILGQTKSADELKRIYRKLAKEVHPDVNPSSVEESTKLMAELNEAYEYYLNKL